MREGVVQEVVNWKDTLDPFMKESNLTNAIHEIIKLHVSLAHLKRHIESVHEGKKPLNLKNHIKSIHEEKNSHKCSFCNFSCSTNSTLKRHFESVHEGKGKTL